MGGIGLTDVSPNGCAPRGIYSGGASGGASGVGGVGLPEVSPNGGVPRGTYSASYSKTSSPFRATSRSVCVCVCVCVG